MKTTSIRVGILGMVLFGIIVFLVVPFASSKLDAVLKLPDSITPADSPLGIISLAIGGTLALWCVTLFLTIGEGTPVPVHPPKRFVVRGPYAYTRNPMMTGAWLVLLGEALLLHSFVLLLLVVFVAIPGGVLFVIRYEERDLEERFGNDYVEYKKKVPRWIPRL